MELKKSKKVKSETAFLVQDGAKIVQDQNGNVLEVKGITVIKNIAEPEIKAVPNTTDPYADDYQCPKCGNLDWSFGSWPSCKGNPEDHFPRRGRRLGEKALTTIYELPDGSIFNPTGPNAPIPKNAKRVEFRTIQEVDKYFSQVNKVRGEIADYHIERDKEQWSEHMRQVREEMNSRGTRDNPGLFEMSPMGRDMAMLAMEQYSNYNPQRSQDSYIEAQYYDRNSGRED